eukprot:m.173385 g.173385  ORF g.173385 m.173385 type:complete len:191 (+) comp14847_c1_seq1:36-608(+)
MKRAKGQEGGNRLQFIEAAKVGDTRLLLQLADGLTGEERSLAATSGDYFDRTALHHAALRSHLEATKLLVDLGLGSVDAVDVKGNTALHLCSSAAVAAALLVGGADPLSTNKARRTPRQQADFVGVQDQSLGPVLADWERRHGGDGASLKRKNESLLGWKSLLLAFVLAVLILRYLTLVVENKIIPKRTG